MRTAREVLEAHLRRRKHGELESDLAENYAADVTLLSAEGVSRGHDGVRHLADILNSYLPEGHYSYQQILIDGEVGMLQWTGTGKDTVIHDGADSYVVRAGLIRAQTIHYSTRTRDDTFDR
ncbi:nuclear transport factor 2 family protein [Nocardioides sp. NPDC006273]|uniref:nuclear transport factor 2 family protein n=1 Tax=Nocardioides sp. NPDC006273 TaxID=3155598 RepID=UPI0033AAB5D2